MLDESSSAASDVSLARFNLRIIRATQASAARGKTAELHCVSRSGRRRPPRAVAFRASLANAKPEPSVLLATLASMGAPAERSNRRWLTRVLRRFAAPATRVPKLEQSAAQRARVDTSAWASRPIRFGLLTTCAVAGAGVLGAVLASALPLAAQAAVAIGAAFVGFTAAVGALFAIEWLAAVPRQRNEARDELRQLTQPTDIAQLSEKFSDWVAAKRAGLPQHGLRVVPGVRDVGSEVWLNYEKRQDEIDRLHAKAREEYHERFRAAVVAVLGTVAEEPKDIAALEELAEKLRALAAGDERAKRIAEANGQPVGENQRSLLDHLLTAVQQAVLNHRLVEYGDPADGEQQNRDLFAAHFPSVLPELETWHAAIDRLGAAMECLRGWIPQEVQRRGFVEPDYFDGTVAECFSDLTVQRARLHELGEPRKIQLRCVQDVTTEDGEKRWSAYLHSGRGEIKVGELSHDVEEFTEEGMADFNKAIADKEQDLQACFDAIQRSNVARRVAAEQTALSALRQPLIDQLKRTRITANPVFSESCQYCLAEIGL
jgi:hypothetical protein